MRAREVTLEDVVVDCHCHLFSARVFPVDSYLAVCARRWARYEAGPAAQEAVRTIADAGSWRDLVRDVRGLIARWDREWVGPGGTDLANTRGRQGGIEHILAFALEMLLPANAAEIATLLPDDKPNHLCAPLMMDLDSAMVETPSGAETRWERQVEGCAQLARDCVGRAFPFVAAHPARPDVVQMAVEAIKSQGFFGVKLYPPLGFAPDDPRLAELYAWCERERVPVTTHSSPVAVWSDLGAPPNVDPMRFNVDMARPSKWTPVLEKFPRLRLNLGHFGGQWLARAQGAPSPWVEEAVSLMRRYANCYADVSYHLAALHADPAIARRYFSLLRQVLHSDIGAKILWGTDHVILRARCRHEDYVAAFAPPDGGLTEEEFVLVANRNPRRFLDLDRLPERYLRFVSELAPTDMPRWVADQMRSV